MRNRKARVTELSDDLGGPELKGTRGNRGLSINRLALISGVSRRHIAAAEAGKNYSVLVLKKLMRALQMTNIQFGDLSAEARGAGVDPGVIEHFADEMDRALEIQRDAINGLRAYAAGRTVPDRNAKAAALIHQVTARARASMTPNDIEGAARALEGSGFGTPASRRRRQP